MKIVDTVFELFPEDKQIIEKYKKKLLPFFQGNKLSASDCAAQNYMAFSGYYNDKIKLKKRVENQSIPLITVGIPVKNNLTFLTRAIYSVLSQTYQNIRIIIVNNSEDLKKAEDTILEMIDGTDISLMNVTLPGEHHARQAIYSISSDFYSWCSADDMFAKQHLELLMNFHQDYNAIVPSQGTLIEKQFENLAFSDIIISNNDKTKFIKFISDYNAFDGIIAGGIISYKLAQKHSWEKHLYIDMRYGQILLGDSDTNIVKISCGSYLYSFHTHYNFNFSHITDIPFCGEDQRAKLRQARLKFESKGLK